MYLEVCRALAGPSLTQMAEFVEISWHEARSTGLGVENPHFSSALIMLWETLSISSLSAQPLFHPNAAVSPTRPEDVLILGGREAWSNQGLVNGYPWGLFGRRGSHADAQLR